MSNPDADYDNFAEKAIIADLERVDEIKRDLQHARNELAQYRLIVASKDQQIRDMTTIIIEHAPCSCNVMWPGTCRRCLALTPHIPGL